MKTSLVSSAVSSASIKADRPQQLKSVTVYWRGRKMVLMQRPQRRLSVLLCRMLRRSKQSLFGTLIGTLANKGRRALGTAALATGALASMSAYAGITDITLPVNGTVQSGAAAISTVGNQMTVTQATDKAIIDWQSFSIGSKAGVNFIQNNANSVALNRVTGNDPSLIMGSLTANGKLFLVNAAGILVGKHAKIDVAGFVASTLNISNADFLAGKMNFAAEAGKHIGNVKNKGEITVHDGGSVYLIGANVENDGIINAPNGEVLLAAGRVVKLIDTTLPGVSIDVGGIAGKVTNLGRIMASAGTVGIGAALIDNSGTINASSVTKEGGRIFLRASQDLTTSSTSMINADGTVGGNVVLYADHSANIDGDVSALGNVDGNGGKGGYVDTSGKLTLGVKYVPRIGAGGEWYIDPFNITIVPDAAAVDDGITLAGGAITASSTGSTIHATTINTQLANNVSVTVSTGTTGDEAGDITINSGVSIAKNAGAAATFTLSAAGKITISSGASILDNGGGNLGLVLNAGGAIENNGTITMGSGAMQAQGTSFTNSGTIFLGGGSLTSSSDITNNTNGTIAGTGTINLGAHTLINNSGIEGGGQGGVIIGADSSHTGTLTVNGNYTQSSTGVLQVKIGRGASGTGAIVSDKLVVNGNVSLAGNLKVTGQYQSNEQTYTPMSGDKAAVLNYTGTRTGYFAAQTGLNTIFANYVPSFAASGKNVAVGFGTAGSAYFSGAASSDWDNADNWSGHSVPITSANVYVDVGSTYSVMHSNAVADAIKSLTIASGKLEIAQGSLDVAGVTSVEGSSVLNVSGGTLTTNGLGVALGSTMHVSSGTAEAIGTTSISGSVTVDQTGVLKLDDSLSGSGLLSLGGAGQVTLGGVSNLDHVAMSGGTFNANNNFSTADLTMSGGQINSAADHTFSVIGSLAQTGGAITINGSGTFQQSTGNLSLGNIGGQGALTLKADNGAITQQAGTALVADSINATAINGITLNSNGNSVNRFTARNGVLMEGNGFGTDGNAHGNIVLTNTADTLTLDGNIKNEAASNGATDGNITIINTGDITGVATHSQSDGSVLNGTYAHGKVALTAKSVSNERGNVTLAQIVATDLEVNADRAISQEGTNAVVLNVTGTMTATAGTGITLTGNSNVTSFNHIANFKATNNTSGDITLTNQSTGESVNNLVQITNNGGNVLVDNTGAMKTTGLISASNGSVTLHTHSPLTIGAGGISAGNGVTLTAGTGASASDALTLNGVIQTTLGNLTFGGNSVTPNAPIFGPNAPIFNSTTPVVPGPGFAFNPVTIVTPPAPPLVVVTTNTVDQNVASTSNISGNLTDLVAPTTNNQQNAAGVSSNQTIGGNPGEFGGNSNDDDGKGKTATKSNKPLPVCS